MTTCHISINNATPLQLLGRDTEGAWQMSVTITFHSFIRSGGILSSQSHLHWQSFCSRILNLIIAGARKSIEFPNKTDKVSFGRVQVNSTFRYLGNLKYQLV